MFDSHLADPRRLGPVQSWRVGVRHGLARATTGDGPGCTVHGRKAAPTPLQTPMLHETREKAGAVAGAIVALIVLAIGLVLAWLDRREDR